MNSTEPETDTLWLEAEYEILRQRGVVGLTLPHNAPARPVSHARIAAPARPVSHARIAESHYVQRTQSGATRAGRSSARPAFLFIVRGTRSRYKRNHARSFARAPEDLRTGQTQAASIVR